jgi:hypothetical protein
MFSLETAFLTSFFPFNFQHTAKLEGVSKVADNKYRACAWIDRKQVNIGNFCSEEEAAAAYDQFILEHSIEKPLNFAHSANSIMQASSMRQQQQQQQRFDPTMSSHHHHSPMMGHPMHPYGAMLTSHVVTQEENESRRLHPV